MIFQNVLLIANINGNHNQRILYIDGLIKFYADYIHVLFTCSKYDCKILICMEMMRGSFQIVHIRCGKLSLEVTKLFGHSTAHESKYAKYKIFLV